MKTRHILAVSTVSIALMSCISAPASPRTIPLWGTRTDSPTERELPRNNKNVRRITDITNPSITVYPAPQRKTPAPAVLICPGGGYKILAINLEGTEVAAWLNSIGLTAVVLKYSVPDNRTGALQDAQRAMRLIRANSKTWGIDPDRIGILGFSAGGHLAARLSNSYRTPEQPIDKTDRLRCRPDFTLLIYPAYLGNKTYELPPEIKITTDTPPAFIVQAFDDKKYINSSIAYALALKAHNIPVELHLFESGRHGFGLRPSDQPASHWPELCERWLKHKKQPIIN